ncbi:MAG: winged helix-turn-helix domain-containing protein [Lactobacillus sp.]|jgi:restriction endonuclease Mrr|nr:winged helix-turn-helix domain-containing protein [Lactobacillus sp.]MCH4068189.1 winged helix-turn-helix domain-containing protein [Lactobacillus sp.]
MVQYNKLTKYKQEDFLEIEIIKYLQKNQQPTTRAQIAEYLVKNVGDIPNNSLKLVTSRKTGRQYRPFMNRLSFALTSLYKAGIIDHPKWGVTILTKFGTGIDTSDEKYIHELVMKGWGVGS